MNLRALAAADPDTPSGSAGAEWQLHAVRFDPNVSATNAGAYVAEGGDWTPAEEMTRSDLKTGRTGNRTPFQILADYYQTGDTRDRDLWREFSRVTRALRVVRWSRGLRRSILGLDADNELTDEDLAAEDVNGELVAALDTAAWSRLRVAGLDLVVLVAVERAGRRAGRGELHEPVLVPADVGVQPPAEHGIEGLGPAHVGDRDDDYLEVGAHGPVIPGSGGNPNTASRPGFPNEVTWLIPRSVTVSTQTP